MILSFLVLTLILHTHLAMLIANSNSGEQELDYHSAAVEFNEQSKSRLFAKRSSINKKMVFNLEKSAQKGSLEKARKTNRLAQVSLIILLAIFNTVFWTAALLQYWKPLEDHLKENL